RRSARWAVTTSSAVPAKPRGVDCPRCVVAVPIASRRACATICCAAASRPASSCAWCERPPASTLTTDRRQAECASPHATAGVRELIDDGAVAPDQLGAAELVDAPTPLVDVLVAERFVPCRAAKRRLRGAATEGVAQERVDLAHLRVGRGREHAARVRHTPARDVGAIHGLETGERGEPEVDVAIKEIALAILELT